MDEEERRVSDAAFAQSMGSAVVDQSAGTGFVAPVGGVASDAAFKQLDGAPEVSPLEYDPVPADGLSQDLQNTFQQNWENNLAAAADAVRGLTSGSDGGDEFSQYTQSLLKLADEPAPQQQDMRTAEITQRVGGSNVDVTVPDIGTRIVQELGDDPFDMI